MVNLDFATRLKQILSYYDISATAFAESIDTQRSSISHLLSGRNKPSLDFVLKVLEKYPEVKLYWLVNGKGHFPDHSNSNINSPVPIGLQKKEPEENNENLFSSIESKENEESINNTVNDKLPSYNDLEPDTIEKIVIFYKNGKFKSYTP